MDPIIIHQAKTRLSQRLARLEAVPRIRLGRLDADPAERVRAIEAPLRLPTADAMPARSSEPVVLV